MTLKEKFEAALVFTLSRELHNEKCEQITDDYAIEFAEWIVKNCNHSKLKFLDYKELLQTFKKEKGL